MLLLQIFLATHKMLFQIQDKSLPEYTFMVIWILQ